MNIKIQNIIKKDPNIDMWVANIKIKNPKQIKSAFAGDKFTLKDKEMGGNARKYWYRT